MKPIRLVLALFLLSLHAGAFCGFYVAQADTKLFNQSSKVVVVRDGDTTTLTMANDYEGDLKEFAAVFPVPVVLQPGDVKVVRMETIEHLDKYSAPRLVEYHDSDPCAPPIETDAPFAPANSLPSSPRSAVKVEAEFQVEEYDVKILSATESGGLATWLSDNGYQLPTGAEKILGSYLKQGMKFFVAKVNLEEQNALGFTYLRPLRVSYTSKKFSLPIRLGTLNAKGDQDLFAFMITRRGRVECTNYKTVKLPTGQALPWHVRDEFPDFYRDMFSQQHQRYGGKAVFTEYAWNMSWCDPCAAAPLSVAQLQELGCNWQVAGGGQARQAFITRLHLRYNATTFPEDLLFQETADEQNFQGRYVLHNPWKGALGNCDAAASYVTKLKTRQDEWARDLSSLTGWEIAGIRKKMSLPASLGPNPPTTLVLEGDTLFAISRKYKVSVEELKRWNRLSDDRILVGQELRIKAP